MKKLGFCFLVLLVGALAVVAQDSEKQAIIKMIEAQHTAFANRDYDAWASYQIQTEEFIFIGGSGVPNVGWNYYKTAKPAEPALFKNYEIFIANDKAWAILDAFNRQTSHQHGKEMYSVRKVDGQWKVITCMTFGFN